MANWDSYIPRAAQTIGSEPFLFILLLVITSLPQFPFVTLRPLIASCLRCSVNTPRRVPIIAALHLLRLYCILQAHFATKDHWHIKLDLRTKEDGTEHVMYLDLSSLGGFVSRKNTEKDQWYEQTR